jgi:hypothetical protein
MRMVFTKRLGVRPAQYRASFQARPETPSPDQGAHPVLAA